MELSNNYGIWLVLFEINTLSSVSKIFFYVFLFLNKNFASASDSSKVF